MAGEMDSHHWLGEWTTVGSEHSILSVLEIEKVHAIAPARTGVVTVNLMQHIISVLSTNAYRIALQTPLTNLSFCNTCSIRSLGNA